jgi:hypothetical protein
MLQYNPNPSTSQSKERSARLRLLAGGTKVLAFVNYYNWTMAKPFRWTYQGKALTA